MSIEYLALDAYSNRVNQGNLIQYSAELCSSFYQGWYKIILAFYSRGIELKYGHTYYVHKCTTQDTDLVRGSKYPDPRGVGVRRNLLETTSPLGDVVSSLFSRETMLGLPNQFLYVCTQAA